MSEAAAKKFINAADACVSDMLEGCCTAERITLLQEHSFADSSELKRIEKEIKKVSSVMPLTLHACRCLNSRM